MYFKSLISPTRTISAIRIEAAVEEYNLQWTGVNNLLGA